MRCPPAVDSLLRLEEALAGTGAPSSLVGRLCLLDICYVAFDGRRHQGQIVVHETVRQDVLEIFELMEKVEFPIARVIPVVQYRWSDDASMAANNSSAFNYRFVAGTKRLSAHAMGLAVDINPLLNPVIYEDGRIAPAGAHYLPERPGVLSAECPVVQEFQRRGWLWGGAFQSFKDYHHFEFKIENEKCKVP